MAYIGSKPADKALTGADIEDGTIQIADLAATGTKDATTFLRGDGAFASAGGSNVPAFSVNMSANQSISDNTNTLVAFDTEDFDSNGAFDNSGSNYKFTVPAGQGGKYAIFLRINTKDAAQGTISRTYLYKNGSSVAITEVRTGYSGGGFFSNTPSLTYVANLSVGDYLQGYGRIEGTGGGSSRVIQTSGTQFSGFKIIE